MKKFLLGALIFAVVFSLFSLAVFAREEEENKNEAEIKYKPQKIEVKIPALTPKQLGEFKKFDDFVRKEIAEHAEASFFFLNPKGHVVQQGVVDKLENNVLTVNSQGFRMNWQIATDTQVLAARRMSLLAQVNPQVGIHNVNVGDRVKVFGNWDGNNLVAKRIVVLSPRFAPQVEDLLQRLQEALRKAGVQIDLTPIFQQLQQRVKPTATPTPSTQQ